MQFNPLSIRHATVSKQISNTTNIFKATVFTYFSFSEGIEKVQKFYTWGHNKMSGW